MNTPYQEALGSTLISRGIREKIVLVAVTMSDRTDDETQDSLDELAQLLSVVMRLTALSTSAKEK